MGFVGCYSMDMYCDHPACRDEPQLASKVCFTGYDRASTLRQARMVGWKINLRKSADVPKGQSLGTGTAICPGHQDNVT